MQQLVHDAPGGCRRATFKTQGRIGASVPWPRQGSGFPSPGGDRDDQRRPQQTGPSLTLTALDSV